jgi:hypothetical protein
VNEYEREDSSPRESTGKHWAFSLHFHNGYTKTLSDEPGVIQTDELIYND